MSATVYEILPAERTWPEHAEHLAQGLMDGVEWRGRPSTHERAALSILFRDPAMTFARADFLDFGFISRDQGRGQRVHWMYLATSIISARYLQHEPPTRALIKLACSLACDTVRIPIAATLAQLAEPERETVLDAVAIAAQVTR